MSKTIQNDENSESRHSGVFDLETGHRTEPTILEPRTLSDSTLPIDPSIYNNRTEKLKAALLASKNLNESLQRLSLSVESLYECWLEYLAKNEENNDSTHHVPSDLETGHRVDATIPKPRTQQVPTYIHQSVCNNPAYECWFESNTNNQNVLPNYPKCTEVDQYLEDDQRYVSEPRTLIVEKLRNCEIPSRLQNKHFCEPPLTLKRAEGNFFPEIAIILERGIFTCLQLLD